MELVNAKTLETLVMNKEIEKVVIFYKDGTFSEIKNVERVQEFGDRPNITPEWFNIKVARPCALCGIDLNTTSGSCGNSLNCPSGRGFPPINVNDIRD